MKPPQRGITVVFYPAKSLSLMDLLHLGLDNKDSSHTESGYYGTPQIMTLMIDFTERQRGGFKLAYFGSSNLPLTSVPPALSVPALATNPICAKVSFYTVKDKNGIDIILHHKYATQLADLGMEIRCLIIANALQELVYECIDAWLAKKGLARLTSAVPIPEIHFVPCGIAVESNIAPEKAQVFLLEPHIKGTFRKYIHNRSPTIPSNLHGRSRSIAEFLAFCQHVQYFKTGKQVFVSDYQGK